MEKFEGEQFINTVLISNVNDLIEKGFDYLAFVIIGQGIETLGSFFDDKPFDHYEVGLPKKRFLKGLSLMDNRYQAIGDLLWENLRCGLAHQLKPKKDISLTSYKSKATDLQHLYKGDKTGNTYLVVDTLFKDFKSACLKVIEKLKDPTNNEIPADKKLTVHLTVGKIEFITNPTTGLIEEKIE
jgi:hypothetical protein